MPPSITGDAFVGRRHEIERSLVCAMQGQFPVLARGASNELAAVFRTGAGHYGLSGTLATACSVDGGRTWSDPIEVAPRGADVRNPAFAIDARGRWLLAYWKASVHCYPAGAATGERSWRLPERRAPGDEPDLFVATSGDRGRTWSEPRPQRCDLLAWCSPFGRIVTAADGTAMMAVYGPALGGPANRFGAAVLRSRDGGVTWGDATHVLDDASELSLCYAAPDRLVGAIRRADGRTAVVHSADAGRTWTPPVAITRTGEHPADVCLLRSGRLLMTFGRRRRPLGCGALISSDRGETWDRDREAILAGDGIGNDVGYPSTVQLDDGTIVTAMYFARGSAASEPADGWGETSCQALRYPEHVVAP